VASQELNRQSETMAEVVLRLREMVGGNSEMVEEETHRPARRITSTPARQLAHVGGRSKYEPVKAGRDSFPLDDSFKEF
jgi:hypothetical protein